MAGQEVPGTIRVSNTQGYEVGDRITLSAYPNARPQELVVSAVLPASNQVTLSSAPIVAGVDSASGPDRTVMVGVDASGRTVDEVRRDLSETLASDFSEIEQRFAAEMARHNAERIDAAMMGGARADPPRYTSGGTVTGRMSADAPNHSSLPRSEAPRTTEALSREAEEVIQVVYAMVQQGLREGAGLADQENERGQRIFTFSLEYEQAQCLGHDPQEVLGRIAPIVQQAFTYAETERLFPRGVTVSTDIDRDIRVRQYQIAIVIDYSRVRPVVRSHPRHLVDPDGLATNRGEMVTSSGGFRVATEIVRHVPVGNRGEIRYKAGEIRSLKDLDNFLKEAGAAVRADLLKQKVIGPESDLASKPVQKRRLTVKKEG
jgi:hypothetical protein